MFWSEIVNRMNSTTDEVVTADSSKHAEQQQRTSAHRVMTWCYSYLQLQGNEKFQELVYNADHEMSI